MREEISKILVKWNMPTRQAAIGEIIALIEAREKSAIELAEDVEKFIMTHSEKEANYGVKFIQNVAYLLGKVIALKNTRLPYKYQDMCGDCARKVYGRPKRDMGAITVSMGLCHTCGEKAGIIPASDLYYAYEKKVNTEDWD